MKYTLLIITIMTCLLLSSSVFAQGFVEVFRSEPGRRPPRGITSNMDIWSIRDLDGNGSPDFTTIFNDTIYVRDGRTKNITWSWPIPSQYVNIEVSSVRYFEFYEGGENSYLATHGLISLDQDDVLLLVDLETGNTNFQTLSNALIAVADIDGDDTPEVVLHDKANKQVVAIGWDDGGNSPAYKSEPDVALSKSSAPYQLSLKFESDSGLDVAYDGELFASVDDFDHNGDGVMELSH